MKICRLDERHERALVRFLERIDHDLPIPLSEKVVLEEYARKVLSVGKVYAALPDDADLSLEGVAAGYTNDLSRRRAYITLLAVDAQLRSQGFGAALLKAFERDAVATGCVLLGVETHHTNERALRFYVREGYACKERMAGGNVYLEKRLVWLTPERPNILLTSAGRRTYLVEYFKEALGGAGEVHAVNSQVCPAFQVADGCAVSPLIYDKAYIPFLLEYCEKNRIGALFSLFDVDIPVLAAHRAEFEELGCLPVVASTETARVCNDKFATMEFLGKLGLPAIPSFVDLESCEQAIDEGRIRFPLILKPRWGMGSIGILQACDIDELRVLHRMVKRSIQDSYLRFESAQDGDKCVLMQPKVSGQEYGLDVMNDLSGRFRQLVVRKKMAMRSGETDSAQVLEPDEAFCDLARRLSAATRHPGNMDVDVFCDANGRLWVLEMNARFGGGYPFSHAAGVKLTDALVSWLRGGDVDTQVLQAKDFGVFQKDIRLLKLEGAGC